MLNVTHGTLLQLDKPTRQLIRAELNRLNLRLAKANGGDAYWHEITPTVWAYVATKRGLRRVV